MYIPTANTIVGFDIDKFLNGETVSNLPPQNIGQYETGKDIVEISNPQNKKSEERKMKIFTATFLSLLATFLSVPLIKRLIKK